MQLDFGARELTIKLVYYGPALSGKTTNLQAMHDLSPDSSRGRLMTLETRDDRTLFFDLLPLTFKGGDLSVRIKLFTVPGQVIHSSTRKLVLQGADGVAFIADSQLAESDNNRNSFRDLKQNLSDNGLSLGSLPLVIQFNKRDLPNVRNDAELAQMAKAGKEPVYKAVAIRREGVLETFLGLLSVTFARLEATHELSKKFHLNIDQLLGNLTRQLGVQTDHNLLIDCAVGGNPHKFSPKTTPNKGSST